MWLNGKRNWPNEGEGVKNNEDSADSERLERAGNTREERREVVLYGWAGKCT